MIRLQAYKFRIEPNGAMLRLLWQFVGNTRKVWNLALAKQQARYVAGEKFAGSFAMNYWLAEWKTAFPFLMLSPSQTLQQVATDLANAYKNFFEKRAAFPVFKKKGVSKSSIRYPQGFKIDEANSRLFLPKLGWVKYRKSRNIAGTPKSITISYSSGHWYASVLTERVVDQPVPASRSSVGIDVGIARFATLSDGTFIEPLHSFKMHQNRLRIAQQALSRKKFSRNWDKAKARVTRIHSTIANCRNDFLHKTTTELCKNHALIIIEDLKVKNMSASAKGMLDVPGKNVKAKSGLNRSILDQGWGIFRTQLDYKQDWNGGMLLAVPPHNTSITCPCCGHKSKDNRTTQALFLCVECGYTEHADVVGSINIHSRGMNQLRDEGQDTVDASTGYESTAQIACEVNAPVMASAAGTHRSDCMKGSNHAAQ